MPDPVLKLEHWKHQPRSLQGCTAIVTGGSSGIGRATVRLLAAAGVNVLTFGLSTSKLDDLMRDSPGLEDYIHPMAADITRPGDLLEVFQQADEMLGRLDILINNAAMPADSVIDSDLDAITRAVQTNIVGLLHCTHLALERMLPVDAGHIVNVGSMSAQLREAGNDLYVATKGAIDAFSESLRKRLSDRGVRVSLIEPGRTGSDMQSSSPDQQRQQQQALETMTAEDVAAAIYYCLTQPLRCDVVHLQIRPHRQAI